MIRISAVSYLNSKPFIYGIEQSGLLKDYSLELDVPAVCAQKLLSAKVDIGLIPVAEISKLPYYEIITDYCIAADGPVASVLLCSNYPLNQIKGIFLDNQSKTSVKLIQVLAKNYWQINPEWIQAEDGYEKDIKNETAGLIIGDRAFSYAKKFNYTYDLADEWKKYTGLPFVFACWVANKKLPQNIIQNFNKAIEFGVNNIDKILTNELLNKYPTIDVKKYLTNNINYLYDGEKKKTIDDFLAQC